MKIGPALKKIRNEKRYTLQEVARRLNVTASHLSQIENDKISPSLHSLEELLKLYAVKISDFFRQAEQLDYILVREGDTETFADERRGLNLTLLASKLQNNVLETYIVELKPGAVMETTRLARESNGERVAWVMEGCFSLVLDGKELEFSKGDSVNFKADISCVISNDSDAAARLLVSGTPPVLW